MIYWRFQTYKLFFKSFYPNIFLTYIGVEPVTNQKAYFLSFAKYPLNYKFISVVLNVDSENMFFKNFLYTFYPS